MSAQRRGAWAAWRTGVRLVGRAPMVVVLVWLVTLLFGIPLGLEVRSDVARNLGSSLEAGRQSGTATYDWLSEFGDQASGVATTLGPQVVGFAAVVDNLSAFLDRDTRPAIVIAWGVGYALLWTLLAGGVIDLYARTDRHPRLRRGSQDVDEEGRAATAARGFMGAVGVFGFPLLRLSVVAALCYGALFGRFHPWLDGQFERLTADLDSERTAFLFRMAQYAVFVFGVAAVNVWFDYAKVRLVVEDRRSVVGALVAAARFIRRAAPAVMGVYLLDAALLGGVMAVYAAAMAFAPVMTGTAMTSSAGAWVAFVIGQVYVAARLWVKLTFWASATALFQALPAHEGAAAVPSTE